MIGYRQYVTSASNVAGIGSIGRRVGHGRSSHCEKRSVRVPELSRCGSLAQFGAVSSMFISIHLGRIYFHTANCSLGSKSNLALWTTLYELVHLTYFCLFYFNKTPPPRYTRPHLCKFSRILGSATNTRLEAGSVVSELGRGDRRCILGNSLVTRRHTPSCPTRRFVHLGSPGHWTETDQIVILVKHQFQSPFAST